MTMLANELTREEMTEGFDYLDKLRESGRTNMCGATAYVEGELGWPKNEAKVVTLVWMETFDGETSVEDRVNKILEIR